MYNDTYPSLWYHTEQFHCPKHPVLCLFIPCHSENLILIIQIEMATMWLAITTVDSSKLDTAGNAVAAWTVIKLSAWQQGPGFSAEALLQRMISPEGSIHLLAALQPLICQHTHTHTHTHTLSLSLSLSLSLTFPHH